MRQMSPSVLGVLILATATVYCEGQTTSANDEPGLAVFEDGFESYAPGGTIVGGGASGFQWTPGNGALPVASTDVAHSGRHSLRFIFAPTEPNGAPHWWTEQRFTHEELNRYWVEFYVYFPDGTEEFDSARYRHESANNKFFSFWSPNGYSREPYGNFSLWGRGGDSNIRLVRTLGNDGSGVDNWFGSERPFVSDGDRGRWIRIRIHIRMADAGQSNGVMRLWKDDQLLIEAVGQPFYDGERGQATAMAYGYLLGYDNGRFASRTHIYIDDFKFFGREPNW